MSLEQAYTVLVKDGCVVVDLIHEHQLYLDRQDVAAFMAEMHQAFLQLIEQETKEKGLQGLKGDASAQILSDIIKAYGSIRRTSE